MFEQICMNSKYHNNLGSVDSIDGKYQRKTKLVCIHIRTHSKQTSFVKLLQQIKQKISFSQFESSFHKFSFPIVPSFSQSKYIPSVPGSKARSSKQCRACKSFLRLDTAHLGTMLNIFVSNVLANGFMLGMWVQLKENFNALFNMLFARNCSS